MKCKLIIGLMVTVLSGCSTTSMVPRYSPTTESIGILEKSKDEMFSYLKAITKGRSARKIENKRQDLLQQIVAEISEIRLVRSYNGDNALKEACIKYLNLQKTILKDDYAKIMDLEELAEKSYDGMEMYLNMQEKANRTSIFNVAINSALRKVSSCSNGEPSKYNLASNL